MKIAQVVCRFKPYKGGISNVAYDYALGLSKLGHQVTVFTPLYNDKDNEVKFDQFEVVRLKTYFKFGNAGFLPQLGKLLRDFDVINLHYPFFGGAEIIYRLKKQKKDEIKLVINYQMDVLGKGLKKIIFGLYNKFLMPRIIASADKVIVSSFDYAQNSDIAGLMAAQSQKFIAIPPGVNLDKFSPASKDQELLDKFNIKPDDKVLLFVGGLDRAHYFKGLEFLINSYKDLNSEKIKILIIGEGDLKSKYQQQVLDLGLIDHILFAGVTTDQDLPKYYNLADAVILPSIDRSEAFGIVLIEAMACAKPVITADLPGVRSVYANNVSGFSFAVLNKDDMIAKIKKLLFNDDLRIKMGQAARERVEKMYGQQKLIIQLEDLYKELVK
ncbi:MAG: glycosyltransferase family 4 protein [Candidatus Parcubacteria bacterium]|nr:glycosyltransferase family 4 protein [Candidatus Parcubacteria bacterium]